MNTRATIHFVYSGETKPAAIIYRHNDGYQEGLGKDIKTFLKEVKDNVKDNRFNDAAYLAAKWVAWDADRHAVKYDFADGKSLNIKAHPLDFLGVGIVSEDPGDIEHRYIVTCDGKPTVKHEKV